MLVRYLVRKNIGLNKALVLAKVILNSKNFKTNQDKTYKKTKKIV